MESLNVPAGALVGAAVGVAAVTLAPVDHVEIPRVASFLAYVGIGWVIGQSFTHEVVAELVRLALPIACAVVALIVAGGVLAVALSRFWGVDAATSFLATSPGGLSQVSALAAAIGANSGVVVTLHVVRVISVILLAPILVRLLPPAN